MATPQSTFKQMPGKDVEMSDVATKPTEEEKGEPSIYKTLSHPLRVRILEVVNQTPISPKQFVRQKLVPPEMYTGYQQALSLTAYHFRELEKEGCAQVIEKNPRRGAMECVYSGFLPAFPSDEEFKRLPFARRQELSRISCQGLAARIDGAIRSGTFDKRRDRYLTWLTADLDAEGWWMMGEVLAQTYGLLEIVINSAASRMGDAEHDKAETPIPVTLALLGFESPSLADRF